MFWGEAMTIVGFSATAGVMVALSKRTGRSDIEIFAIAYAKPANFIAGIIRVDALNYNKSTEALSGDIFEFGHRSAFIGSRVKWRSRCDQHGLRCALYWS